MLCNLFILFHTQHGYTGQSQRLFSTNMIFVFVFFLFFIHHLVQLPSRNFLNLDCQLLAIFESRPLSDQYICYIRGGAPCFRIGGAEDNFIFYIEYCFFFCSSDEIKVRVQYFKVISIHCMSYCLTTGTFSSVKNADLGKN